MSLTTVSVGVQKCLYDYLFTHQISSVNHVRVPITCHPVRKNFGGF